MGKNVYKRPSPSSPLKGLNGFKGLNRLIKSEGGVSPTGVFYPWARWGWGPGQIPELFVRRRIRRIFLKNAKTVFDDETYLEKRLGIILDGNLHSVSLRMFLVFGKKIGFRTEEHFGSNMSYFQSTKWLFLKKCYARGVRIQKKIFF